MFLYSRSIVNFIFLASLFKYHLSYPFVIYILTAVFFFHYPYFSSKTIKISLQCRKSHRKDNAGLVIKSQLILQGEVDSHVITRPFTGPLCPISKFRIWTRFFFLRTPCNVDISVTRHLLRSNSSFNAPVLVSA